MSMTPSGPLVSVVINCLNGDEFAESAIECALTQDYPNIEVVFVDNASTDHTAEIARGFGDRIRYVRSPATVPLGQARNIAIGECKGELIAFLDVDDEWNASKISRQVALFADPRVGLAFCNGYFDRGSGPGRTFYRGSSGFPSEDDFALLLSRYNLVMTACVIRRVALDDLDHWFDDRLQVAEEADVFLRLAARGWRVASVDEPLCTYRVRLQSDTFGKGQLFLDEFELIFSKIEQRHPGVLASHEDTVRALYDRGYWAFAVSAWLNGEGCEVRNALRNVSQRSAKTYLLWLLSALNGRKVMRLLARLRG